MHVRHRSNYAIETGEIRELQFYISTKVLAKDLSVAAGSETAASVVLVPEKTPGVVTEIGDDWLRVSFEEGGKGVVFLTDSSKKDDGYWLATDDTASRGYRRLMDLQEPILRHMGRELEIIYGVDAFLLVSRSDLDELISRRRHIKGRVR